MLPLRTVSERPLRYNNDDIIIVYTLTANTHFCPVLYAMDLRHSLHCRHWSVRPHVSFAVHCPAACWLFIYRHQNEKKYTDYLYEQWVKYILTELVVLSIVEYTAATLCRMQDSLMTLTSLLSHSSCSSSSRRRSIMLVPCTSFTVHLSINYLSRRLHCSVGFLSTDQTVAAPAYSTYASSTVIF